jgi:hypothetical protein
VAKELKNIFPDKDGKIRIHFRTGMAGKPKINAIEVVPAG